MHTIHVQHDAVECSPLITCIVSIGDNSTMDKNNYFPEEMEKNIIEVIIVIIVACIPLTQNDSFIKCINQTAWSILKKM